MPRARLHSNRLLVIDLSTPEPSSVIIHDVTNHSLYFKADITHDTYIRYYISQARDILLKGGFAYVDDSNYFFNNKCGVYIFDGSQVVIYHDSGQIYTYESNTGVIYNLIGYLVVMKLIDLGTKQPDTNDKYEF